MAWTNSAGGPLAAGLDLHARPDVVRHRDRRLHDRAAFDYRWLRTFGWLLYLVNIGLLLLTMAIGIEINGAQRWISLGGLTFQFSELSKPIMVAVAGRLPGRAARIEIGSLSTFIGAGLLIAPPFVLIMIQPDLGTALVLVAILVGALFLSGASLRWMLLAAAHAGRRAADRLVGAARLPAAAPPVVPRSRRRSAGRRLPGRAGPDRDRLGRHLRQGTDQRQPVGRRVPARPVDRLRLRGAARGAGLRRWHGRLRCCSSA